MITTTALKGEGGLRLAALEAGPADGPLVILLHGFPESKESWRPMMQRLAESGFHVLAPDQRGYGDSARPKGVAAYDLDRLTADVVAVMDGQGASSARLVGHDWGALVAWWTASSRPERVERLVTLAAAHPAVWRAAMRDLPAQRRKSWYVAAFQIPALPELLLRLSNFAPLAIALADRKSPASLTPADLAAARATWRRPGAVTAMINWYRAVARRTFEPEAAYRVTAPTLHIWGADDLYGEPVLAERSIALCAQGRLVTLKATHWVQHDAPQEVEALILEAIGPMTAAAP